MKKLLLLLLLSFGFVGSANADAICNDGWISESTGSGTCSWHDGVYKWLPNGWCSRDCDCSAKKIAAQSNSKYKGMIYASALQGCMEGQAQGNLLKLLLNNSNSSSTSKPYSPSKSKKWSCPSGYKRDLADGCVKGFVAKLSEGEAALNKKDYKTAIKHFDLLAKNGSANAQFYIGKMYEKGISFKQNDYWAHHWINKAAQLGLSDAQYTLGYFYRNGVGVVKDSTQTVKWFKKAGKKGHAKAQFNLGAMYINGDNVVKSLKDAKYWINLAMNNNHPRAEAIWNDFELWKY